MKMPFAGIAKRINDFGFNPEVVQTPKGSKMFGKFYHHILGVLVGGQLSLFGNFIERIKTSW
ncbi:MAG: hypothetical protein CM15mP109_11880 [Candidatus Dadabacteria bacterium]|nr:MAG: hypothetical protein CM15mP109_11880 [Candidatus Dadabacteria bacterium]